MGDRPPADAEQGAAPTAGVVKALAFDVFGTVVDWRGSLLRACRRFGRERGLHADWPGLVDAWRGGYRPAMDRVNAGDLPWMNVDALHRMILDNLVDTFGLAHLGEVDRLQLTHSWHRLRPWPDALPGLRRLRKRHVITTLSNGNMALLVNMAKQSNLPWDCILSAELVRRYKPDALVYRQAAAWLGLQPSAVLMVAAHTHDLEAARAAGLRTAYVHRPFEFGRARPKALPSSADFDHVASDLLDLAAQLEA